MTKLERLLKNVHKYNYSRDREGYEKASEQLAVFVYQLWLRGELASYADGADAIRPNRKEG